MKDKSSSTEVRELRVGEIYGDVPGVARILNLFIVVVLLGLSAGILIVLSNKNNDSALILTIEIFPVLMSLYLVRKKRLEAAAIFLGVSLILMNTVLSTRSLGIHSINNLAYPVILIVASLVTGRRTIFLLTFFTIICIGWLVFGEIGGLYIPAVLVRSVPGDFFSASIIVILAAMMVQQLTGSMFRSYSRVQKEVVERRIVEENLRQREVILEAVTFAAEQFLKAPDWRENIDLVLERLGKTINATHAYLFEDHMNAQGEPVTSMRYEWTAPGYPSDLESGHFQSSLIHQDGFEEQVEKLRQGDVRFGTSSTFNPIEKQAMQGMGVKSILEVPIFVNGREWGAIGFDDFEKEREWSTAEMDALKIAAGVLSAAIHRQEAESAVLESEWTYRQAIQAAGMVPYYRDYVKHRYTFVGEGILDITGYSADELTPQIWAQMQVVGIPRGRMAHLTYEAADRLTEQGLLRYWECDYLLVNRLGQERWVSDACIQVLDEKNTRVGVMGILQDITDRKNIEAGLRKRESILEAITFSAEQFLKVPDWRLSITSVLERLGKEFHASHAYLFEKHMTPEGVMLNSISYEWAAPGQNSDMENPAYLNAPEREAEFKRYYSILNRGDPYVGSSSYFTDDEKKGFGRAGIKAILELRIVVDGKQWGTLGFDDMVNEREWTTMEVDVLKVAANVLGAAIKRQLDEDALKNELAERRRAELALRFSEEKFSKAFHTTQVWMTIEDNDRHYIDVNKAFEDVVGIQRDDLIGHSASELDVFYDPADAVLLQQEYQQNGFLKDFEIRFRRRTGEIGTALLSSEKFHMEGSEYTLTSGLDITERKRVEQQIKQHAARAEVLATLSHVLTRVNQDYRLTLNTVVQRCAELIGDGASIFSYSPDNEFLELVAVYNPDPEGMRVFWDEIGKRPIKWNEGAYAKAISENQPVLIPFIDVNELIKRAPPERREYYKKLPFHSVMLAPLHVQGKVIGVIGMARHSPGRDYTPEDVTFLQDIADRSALAMLNAQYYKELELELAERKRVEMALRESEARYRALFEQSHDAVFILDLNARHIAANQRATEMLGYTEVEIQGLSANELSAEPPGSENILERMMAREHIPVYERLYRKKNGDVFPVEINVELVRDDAGDPLHIQSVVRDVTQRKQAESEREKLIGELSAKNAELERFTYTVSHDLKSPLVTINGFLGYLEQDAASGDMVRLKHDSQRIREAVNKMQRLLSELLELSRIGRSMNAPVAFPFDELVAETLEIVHGRLEERGVVVHTHPNLPVIYGDRPRLLEVMQNLIDNAAKYMGGQKSPRVEIGQRGEENGLPILFVKDNGMGIEPEHHERVFGLFNKLDPRSEGTGVGLALVKRIIEFHGGRIWVESEAGNGSTFLFTLHSGAEA